MVLVFVWFIGNTDTSLDSWVAMWNIFDTQAIETSSWVQIFTQKYSLFENLYSSHERVSIEKKDSQIVADISKNGLYMSSFRDLSKNYVLLWNGFEIQQQGIGEIYIDSETQSWSILIYSINTPLNFKLIDSTNDKLFTTIYLNPHMYVVFQPARWKFVDNWDVVRVETAYELWYLPVSTHNIIDQSIFVNYRDSLEQFLLPTLTYIQEKDKVFSTKLTEIHSFDLSSYDAADFIENYASIFFNSQKKIIFLKNKILSEYLEILTLKEFNPSLERKLRDNLTSLKWLSIIDYEEMVQLQNQLNVLVSSNYELDQSIAKLSFASLSWDVSQLDSHLYPVYWFALYSQLDIGAKMQENILKKYIQSFNSFALSHSSEEDNSKLEHQYFSFFLEKQLLSYLGKINSKENIESIVEMLSRYVQVSQIAFSDSQVLEITSLYKYSSILENFDEYLRNTYFSPERSVENLLTLSNTNSLSSQNILDLKLQIKNISGIYNQKSRLLSPTNPRDNLIAKNIKNSILRLGEYFDALENYESYIAKYDVSKITLLQSAWEDENKIVVSERNALNYLSQFLWTNIENTKVEVIDESYYKITNFIVSWRNFSFELFPLELNKIQNITIDGKGLKFIYKLDATEKEWDERFQSLPEEEKDSSDFKNFFELTFLQNNASSIEDYNNGVLQYDEDSAEIVFKRDILIQGEFNPLKPIIEVKYGDIRLQKKNSNYDIYLEDIPFIQTSKTLDAVSFMWKLDTQYVYNENNKYFKNIVLSLESWMKIQFIGKINQNEFKSFFENLVEYNATYDELFIFLGKKYANTEIDFLYTISSNIMTLKFDSGWKKYTILLEGNLVSKIYEWNRSILSTNIEIKELPSYLP